MEILSPEELVKAVGLLIGKVAALEGHLNTLITAHNELVGEVVSGRKEVSDLSAAIIALQKESIGLKKRLGIPLTETLWAPELEEEMKKEGQ